MTPEYEYARTLLSRGMSYGAVTRSTGLPEASLRQFLPRRMRPVVVPAPHPAVVASPIEQLVIEMPMKGVRVREIIATVAAKHGLPLAVMTTPAPPGAGRRKFAWPRQEAMYEVRRALPEISYPRLGQIFGGRDHTTALHGVTKHAARLAWAECLIAMWPPEDRQPDLFAVAA